MTNMHVLSIWRNLVIGTFDTYLAFGSQLRFKVYCLIWWADITENRKTEEMIITTNASFDLLFALCFRNAYHTCSNSDNIATKPEIVKGSFILYKLKIILVVSFWMFLILILDNKTITQ